MEDGGQMKKKFMRDLLLKVDKKMVKISSLNTTSTNICKKMFTLGRIIISQLNPTKKTERKQLFFPFMKILLSYPLLKTILNCFFLF